MKAYASRNPVAAWRADHVYFSAIAQAGEKLLECLNAVLGGAVVPRAELEMAAATYLMYYGNHIANEAEA